MPQFQRSVLYWSGRHYLLDHILTLIHGRVALLRTVGQAGRQAGRKGVYCYVQQPSVSLLFYLQDGQFKPGIEGWILGTTPSVARGRYVCTTDLVPRSSWKSCPNVKICQAWPWDHQIGGFLPAKLHLAIDLRQAASQATSAKCRKLLQNHFSVDGQNATGILMRI